MMKGIPVLILSLFLGVGLVSSTSPSARTSSSASVSSMVYNQMNSVVSAATNNRKLKEGGFDESFDKKSDPSNVNLNDYLHIDPVPNYKASIRPGPIQHDAPIVPHIPKSAQHGSPPGHPKHG